MQAMESEILVTPWKDDVFVQKDFEAGRRLYIWKRANLEHSKNTVKVTVLNQL